MVRKEIVSQVIVFNSLHNIFLQDQSCWFRLQQVYGLIPDHSVPAGYKLALYCDQGSVLVVRAFGSLSIYFALQPEVVPNLIS